ncbi:MULTISPECIES: RNA polymerase sigma factor SigB [unclassified Sporolactobacillus]|uniref:RNA polymerase sigma factor SigB n=1 Tax=unclassified Sporolactobacillus TaxID=2628533 RepID=UPI002368611F|nr:RNA polymerase sigma factor SigB [Sporolactobacillus sp. CQH2019]MDD9150765.1 RNA polymerase sigma factor SigB [Sporolactobacillus sp. CQH2019]
MPTKSQQQQNDIQQILAYQKDPGNESLQNKLISRYENLVGVLSNKFAGNRDVREDLFQVGMIGLISALKRFDPVYGRSFESFAVPTIIGEIKRYIRDKTWSVHVPRRIKELGPKIKKAAEELTNNLQRSPRIEEIAEAVGESEESILETMEMTRSYNTLSVDSQIESDAEGGTVTLLDIVGNQDKGYEKINKKILLEKAFRVLTDREKEIIVCTYFDTLSQKETGERLGISQMHVSRLQRRALRKLRETFSGEGSEKLAEL